MGQPRSVSSSAARAGKKPPPALFSGDRDRKRRHSDIDFEHPQSSPIDDRLVKRRRESSLALSLSSILAREEVAGEIEKPARQQQVHDIPFSFSTQFTSIVDQALASARRTERVLHTIGAALDDAGRQFNSAGQKADKAEYEKIVRGMCEYIGSSISFTSHVGVNTDMNRPAPVQLPPTKNTVPPSVPLPTSGMSESEFTGAEDDSESDQELPLELPQSLPASTRSLPTAKAPRPPAKVTTLSTKKSMPAPLSTGKPLPACDMSESDYSSSEGESDSDQELPLELPHSLPASTRSLSTAKVSQPPAKAPRQSVKSATLPTKKRLPATLSTMKPLPAEEISESPEEDSHTVEESSSEEDTSTEESSSGEDGSSDEEGRSNEEDSSHEVAVPKTGPKPTTKTSQPTKAAQAAGKVPQAQAAAKAPLHPAKKSQAPTKKSQPPTKTTQLAKASQPTAKASQTAEKAGQPASKMMPSPANVPQPAGDMSSSELSSGSESASGSESDA